MLLLLSACPSVLSHASLAGRAPLAALTAAGTTAHGLRAVLFGEDTAPPSRVTAVAGVHAGVHVGAPRTQGKVGLAHGSRMWSSVPCSLSATGSFNSDSLPYAALSPPSPEPPALAVPFAWASRWL